MYVACLLSFFQETLGFLATIEAGGLHHDKLNIVLKCIFGIDPLDFDSEEFSSGFTIGIFIGFATRLYVSIALAKLFLRNKK